MADVTRASQLYVENVMAGAFAYRARVSQTYLEHIRSQDTGATRLWATQAYVEHIRSRSDPTAPSRRAGLGCGIAIAL